MYVFRTLLIFVAGILSPLLGSQSEERAKNISHQGDTFCDRTLVVYQSGTASWYGAQFHGKTMANGHPFNMHALTVAHRKLPLGTPVCVTNPENGKQVGAYVTDRGPYVHPRVIDLSYRVASALGITVRGHAHVVISVLVA